MSKFPEKIYGKFVYCENEKKYRMYEESQSDSYDIEYIRADVANSKCVWSPIDDYDENYFETDCKEEFMFSGDGKLSDHNMIYCCFCGKNMRCMGFGDCFIDDLRSVSLPIKERNQTKHLKKISRRKERY